MSEGGQGNNGGDAVPDPDGVEPERTVIVEDRRRPWLLPAIFSVILAIILILLLIPGVLLYPEEGERFSDDQMLDMQRDTNEALEDRIQELQELADAAVCFDEGLLFEEAPDGSGLQPLEATPDVIPPPPSDVTLPSDVQEHAGEDVETLVDLLDATTVLVIAQSPGDGGSSSGTGFFISPTQVVTNLHVVGNPPMPELWVVAPGLDGVVPAKVVARSPNDEIGRPDFAVLEIADATAGSYLSVSNDVDRLDNVIAAGFPAIVIETDENYRRLMEGDMTAMPTVSFTDGVVTALQHPSDADLILHSAAVSPGNSGGPLVDRCGRVVGINTFVNSEETYRRMNYALSAAELVAFLSANGLGGKRAN